MLFFLLLFSVDIKLRNKIIFKLFEPFHEKTNIIDYVLCIDLDQSAQSAQANPGRHIPS